MNLNHGHRSMRKFIYILTAAAAMVSCSKSGLEIKSGDVVAEMNVTATSGRVSVSVETVGRWIVHEAPDVDWVSIDVEGGVGKGAFTVSYDANMSNVADLKSARKARIVVTSEDHAKSDTLNIVQQGFNSVMAPSEVKPSQEIILEFEEDDVKTVTIVYCSAEGVSDLQELSQWAESFDIVACGGSFIKPEVTAEGNYAECEYNGLNLVSADLGEHWAVSAEQEFDVFRQIVESTYNAYDSPSKWIIGGQLYHYSMMQTSYQSTPDWYPADIEDPLFDADRYAWNNNLYDCLWMAERNFVETFVSEQGAYMADYIYVSRDVLATVYSVEKLDKVSGMTHNPVKITLKY